MQIHLRSSLCWSNFKKLLHAVGFVGFGFVVCVVFVFFSSHFYQQPTDPLSKTQLALFPHSPQPHFVGYLLAKRKGRHSASKSLRVFP